MQFEHFAKSMDGATAAHLKGLFRTIKYILDTRKKCLVFKPKIHDTTEWTVSGKSDSDYAGDKDTRFSVSGCVIYANGALIAWKSCGQKRDALSSTEAEYVPVTELCTEILFVIMVIESLGMKVKTPIQLQMDNVGAIFLAHNTTTGQRTKKY
jgi:hypothetical protein